MECSDACIETVSNALRDLTSDDALAAFCSANTIERYVKARNGDVTAATYMLRRPMTACSTEEQTKFWIYNLETACKMADDAGVGQVIVAADLANFSEGLTQLASFIHLAQNHYPERLAFAVLSRPPTYFWLAWSAAQAFLDEKTSAKITLVYTNDELRTALLPHIQPAHLYQSLGGDKKDDFDLEGHRQRMQLMDLERQREAGFFKSQGQNAVKVQ
ncbi:CRAL/TRIO domain-containing protein [Coccomyxa subellipsoidea C-169]|uniref:CRAL/TRIO domain-containing protein n=1 Tax=Coccomyxa subellipsoidea (strain C-169) TaxID=574566 RepID=I0Z0D1_COCSC|nr:CRAL/TRIO domain-containing protein [Coccomyxa subellipsoidea C-169]EIE24100.1 CRAL/TRIO domain-containing protein [Coccomyxa subellipsoidea C-169]|eukprot:XP_005648644.1 CRAL/TRIO domain-containing protein [Coccomyxa subellipsoidea C-169]